MEKMSRFYITILLAVLGMNAFAAKTNRKKCTVKTKIYCDHCVKCESCKSRIEDKVYALKGVKLVDVDPEKETILIVYNPRLVNENAIRQQILLSGYDADDLKATEAQVAGLDACCHK